MVGAWSHCGLKFEVHLQEAVLSGEGTLLI